ncbi:DUF2092 domain-containing protein [Acuticoccus mangrovi]|uniref:DUF2092 domain-containing protein n=1 Tax=Acuticoccus mangrovi TaxID=2796142 RepID=A0A934IS77_9HYPH|nr:DUF2092 domain-containing protein [Acuticoccus mangrovi]MBJ3776709.1 DUF2092 domain-containing protein [Acuticoccus mangrovi]
MIRSLQVARPAKPTVIVGLVLATSFAAAATRPASADEAVAKSILKSMSDYLASQPSIAFTYDSTFDVVTDDGQTLGIASSGTVVLKRPDHVMATRVGGFANVEMLFDGKDVALVDKTADAYVEIALPGSVDHLLQELYDKYGFPLPATDLLASDPYELLMDGVTDIKDLGAGVIGGVECDHLAFRTEAVDWQIFVAQGDEPVPCRYVITSKDIPGSPKYEITLADWQVADDVPETSFTYDDAGGAKKITIEEMRAAASELPPFLKPGAQQ